LGLDDLSFGGKKMLCGGISGRVLRSLRPCIRGKYMAASSFVSKFDGAVSELPLMEIVRYKDSNLKMAANEFRLHAEAHANALLEHKFKQGDVLALWMPEGAERQVTMIAAAKAGLKVVDIDSNIIDIPSIREFLRLSQAKAIYCFPFYNDTEYVTLLRKAVPEFFHYDNTEGQHFHSKHFPKLKYFVQLGFDNEFGCLTYRELFLKNPPTNYSQIVSQSLSDDTPLYAEISKNNGTIKMTPFASHSQAADLPAFSFAQKIINKEYFEV
jgi:acyl-CoA synthetase (AMP-forming)/AMP-acid ligase II